MTRTIARSQSPGHCAQLNQNSLGRKSRNKRTARILTAEQAKQNRKFKIITLSIVLPAAALTFWSSILSRQTFMRDELILVPSLIVGVIAAVVLQFLWRNHTFPLWVILFFGLFSGGSATAFLISATNYYFRDHSEASVQLDILGTGNYSKRRRSCKTPFIEVVYDDIRKELPFPCEFEKTIAQYKKVNLRVSKGLFGFYVIEDKVLVK